MKTKDKIYIEQMLKEYPRKEKVLRKLDLDIEEIKLEDGLSAVCYDSDNVQTSNISNTVEALAIRKEKEILKILEEKKRKLIHFEKIEIAIDSLTDLQSKLIEYRHFKGYTWSMCETRIGYTDKQCRKIVNDVIDVLFSYYGIRNKEEA